MDGKLPFVRFCQVISVDDSSDAGRIKVRLAPEDNDKSFNDIPYAFPLLPKMFSVKPKVGEAVFVLLAIANDGNSQRYYVGPVISQEHKMYKDSFFGGADSFFRGSYKKMDAAPSLSPANEGLIPNDTDVVVRGRKNAEIQITDNDVRIKAGVKLIDENNPAKMEFNTQNPAYIKLAYNEDGLGSNTNSTAAIVGDKICLLSPSSPNSYNVTDRKALINDEEMKKVIDSAYKLPYGEKLVEFLQVLTNAFINHTHDFSMLPPNSHYTDELVSKKASMLDNQGMLSDTARIN